MIAIKPSHSLPTSSPTLHHARRPDVEKLSITIDPATPTYESTRSPPANRSRSCPATPSPISHASPARTSLPPFPLPPYYICPYTISPQLPMPANFAYFPSPPSTSSSLVPDPTRTSQRQVSLHFALKYLSSHTGMNVWGTIRQHLAQAHAEGRRSSVLDLGCGTGIFSYELGKEEEYADVIGVDIDLSNVGTSVEEESPYNNVDFTMLDVSQPLPYASGSFDVVHIRNLSTGIVNYLQLVERCARILRPGGLLVVTELEHFYHSAVPGYVAATCLRTWQTALREALRGRGIDPEVPSRLRMLVANSAVFQPDMIVEEIGIPTGGAHVASDHFDPDMIAASFEVMQPILLEHGYGAEDVAQLNQDCVAELTEVDNRYFQRITTVCANKVDF